MSVKTMRSPIFKRLGKGIFADDVSGHAGFAAEDGVVGEHARLFRADDVRRVGHLEHVRHVGRGGGIQNGDRLLVLVQADDGADEEAGIDDEAGARFEVNLDVECLP